MSANSEQVEKKIYVRGMKMSILIGCVYKKGAIASIDRLKKNSTKKVCFDISMQKVNDIR